MKRSLACMLALFALTVSLAGSATAQEPGKTPEKPKKEEPSIHGTWLGTWTVVGDLKVKLTSTIRKDGTYRVLSDNSGIITVERGTYKYSDGVLETEPEGGTTGTFTVEFLDKDTIKVKGGGVTITYKRG